MNMYNQDNPYYPAHDFPRNWSADDLAAAVPMRLSDRLSLGLATFERMPQPANAADAAARPRASYLPGAALPPFVRVR
jgi:hypothetical protein